MPEGRQETSELKQLLKLLHYYIDRRREGMVNVTGRKAIVDLIQVCIDNGGTGVFKPSAWDTYWALFERHRDHNLPPYKRTAGSMHKKVEQVFTKAYGKLYFDKDIIQFYLTVGGDDAKAVMEKYKKRKDEKNETRD